MRKFISLLTIVCIFTLSSCSNDIPKYQMEDDNYKLIIVNNMDQFIHFSIIEGTTSATSVKQFNSEVHTYLKDCVGSTLKKQLLSPSGTISGEDQLDRIRYYIPKGSYTCTIFVSKSNTYSGKEDVYINKKTFYYSSDMTITIGSNGSIY